MKLERTQKIGLKPDDMRVVYYYRLDCSVCISDVNAIVDFLPDSVRANCHCISIQNYDRNGYNLHFDDFEDMKSYINSMPPLTDADDFSFQMQLKNYRRVNVCFELGTEDLIINGIDIPIDVDKFASEMEKAILKNKSSAAAAEELNSAGNIHIEPQDTRLYTEDYDEGSDIGDEDIHPGRYTLQELLETKLYTVDHDINGDGYVFPNGIRNLGNCYTVTADSYHNVRVYKVTKYEDRDDYIVGAYMTENEALSVCILDICKQQLFNMKYLSKAALNAMYVAKSGFEDGKFRFAEENGSYVVYFTAYEVNDRIYSSPDREYAERKMKEYLKGCCEFDIIFEMLCREGYAVREHRYSLLTFYLTGRNHYGRSLAFLID